MMHTIIFSVLELTYKGKAGSSYDTINGFSFRRGHAFHLMNLINKMLQPVCLLLASRKIKRLMCPQYAQPQTNNYSFKNTSMIARAQTANNMVAKNMVAETETVMCWKL